ncbi:Peptidase family M49 [Nannocystis exedens]|uniref:Peptidase family M49 n=1 Tax=Nannocystis exedens TaxID=54 RepID=A0A1I1TZS5_9BACT|nr:hypothetical protein [Nannocystis exedens]PCC71304.1 Peptidase family M49 [Nannocystis exedens]SFD63989.1 Peptidase family M49 [Nannocystis exedens]
MPPVRSTIFVALALAACQNPDVSKGGKPAAPAKAVEDADEAAEPAEPAPKRPEAKAPTQAELLRAKIDQFVTSPLTTDVSALPPSEKAALDKLIEAARLMDPIFDRQAWAGNPALRAELEKDTSELGVIKLDYFTIMRGPWDRQAHYAPFATTLPHPPGAGFYPEDLSAEAFKKWVADHPEDKAAFESLTTVIARVGDKLEARPYSAEYGEWLGPAAKALEDAAKLTKNKSLTKFLRSRAQAFRTDDYYQSDKDWMDLDSLVEITIGPYETYEDELLGLKASFEAFVTVSDPKASAELAKYKKYLPEMEQHLPIPDEVKTKRGSESPIRVVDLVFSAGDARKSVQTIAFNLPNDERVRAEKGAKKVLLRNLIQTKFEAIMRPIGNEVLHEGHVASLSGEAFFLQVLFHELSHSLGPAFVGGDAKGKDGKKAEKVDVRVALEASYSPLEEAKADVMGAYNVLYMIEKGELPAELKDKVLLSYFAGLFRSARFGVAEAHGRGAALQLNRFLAAGAVMPESASGKFKVDLAKLETAISDLVRDICLIQHSGDKAAADKLLEEHGKITPLLQAALDRLGDIPVDIRPSYPLAGEILPQ